MHYCECWNPFNCSFDWRILFKCRAPYKHFSGQWPFPKIVCYKDLNGNCFPTPIYNRFLKENALILLVTCISILANVYVDWEFCLFRAQHHHACLPKEKVFPRKETWSIGNTISSHPVDRTSHLIKFWPQIFQMEACWEEHILQIESSNSRIDFSPPISTLSGPQADS